MKRHHMQKLGGALDPPENKVILLCHHCSCSYYEYKLPLDLRIFSCSLSHCCSRWISSCLVCKQCRQTLNMPFLGGVFANWDLDEKNFSRPCSAPESLLLPFNRFSTASLQPTSKTVSFHSLREQNTHGSVQGEGVLLWKFSAYTIPCLQWLIFSTATKVKGNMHVENYQESPKPSGRLIYKGGCFSGICDSYQEAISFINKPTTWLSRFLVVLHMHIAFHFGSSAEDQPLQAWNSVSRKFSEQYSFSLNRSMGVLFPQRMRWYSFGSRLKSRCGEPVEGQQEGASALLWAHWSQ